MQSMWCHWSLGRRLYTTCEKQKEEVLSAKGKGQVVVSEERKSDGKRRGLSNYPMVEVYNDGSNTHASRMKVPPGYAVLDCFFFDTERQTSRETLTVEYSEKENWNGLTNCEPRSQEASFPQNLLD